MAKKNAVEQAPAKLDRAPIKPCLCVHEYQDKLYGKAMRVHTLGGTKATATYTCTACGRKK